MDKAKLQGMLGGPVPEVLNCINAGVYLVDKERNIVFWNKRAEIITGYRADQVIGRHCWDGIIQHRNQNGERMCNSELCPLSKAMDLNKASEKPLVVYAKHVSGESIPLSVSVAPIHDSAGDVIGGVEVFRDESQNMLQMKLAKEVHDEMLTTTLPVDKRLVFDVQSLPVEMVGGDFYRINKISEDYYSLFLADVAGHGISAALYIAFLHSLAEECEHLLDSPKAFLNALNERIYMRVPKVGFVTGLCMTVNADSGRVVYCSAGHPPALLQKSQLHTVTEIKSLNLPMGTEPDTNYTQTEFTLQPGDGILMYTDGVTEMAVGGEPTDMLGVEGLKSILTHISIQDNGYSVKKLYDTLVQKCASHVPSDDFTLISCSKVNDH